MPWYACDSTVFSAVLWIRIRMFLDLPDPDPSWFCTNPDPCISKQNKEEYHWFLLFSDFFGLFKTDVHVPSKCNKQKTLEKNLVFVGILSATDEKSRIRIRMSVVRIHGWGSVPKCHGSTTMVLRQHSKLLHQELPQKADLAKESGTVITSCMIVP